MAAIEVNHPNLTNQKMLYVEISRARDRAELVTDDKVGLKEQLDELTDQPTTALEMLGKNRARVSGTVARGEMRTCLDRTQPGIEPAREPEKTP